VSGLPDFSAVTELPGSPATQSQLARLAQRYHFAAERTRDKRVLEVACGAGLGLGWVAERSRLVVGGDCTERLLGLAKGHYGAQLALVRLDAHALPFAEAAFDALLLFEAAYYLADLQRFLREGRRVLTQQGLLMISSVNPEWAGFSRSSFSTKYASLSRLGDFVEQAGFTNCEYYGGFPTIEGTRRDRIVEAMRGVAAKLHLIPKTLETRALLKRLVYGRTLKLPPAITSGLVEVPPVQATSCGANRTHQIVYVVATKA